MKHHVLKIGFLATALALLSIGLNAQIDYTPFTLTGTESIDSVSVGSRMPYRTDAQTPVTGLTFEYKWVFSPARTVQNLAGTALTEKGSGSNYYDENEISVLMPATTGVVTLTTNVRSLFNGSVLCDAGDVNNPIQVVALPTITWTAGDRAGCEAEAVIIPVTMTNGLDGLPQYRVTYTLRYFTAFDKTGTPATTTGVVEPTGSDLVFPASTFNQGLGVYEITVTNITDRISRKSLDQSLVAAQTLPTGVQNVYIYPAPVANPVQHIRNMPQLLQLRITRIFSRNS